jgi:geranylgeranyl diphosphate synthase type I
MRPPSALTEVAAAVDGQIERLLRSEQQRWSAVDPALAEPFSALREYATAGGKRLRPALCHWAFVGSGGDPDDSLVLDAGVAIEMLHIAALVHDDIIDGSRRRHGADTLHLWFAGLHEERNWHGDPQAFGRGAAILAGDLALVYSSRLMSGAPPPASVVFEEMRLEVNVGQYLDLIGTAVGLGPAGDAVERARRICRYKTAKYTVERPLHLGAALASPAALGRVAGPLSEFAMPLGEAFQLRDDLLGLFGDPEATGKAVGEDLWEGKPTLLAALTAASVSGEERQWFVERFGSPDLSPDDVAAMQRLVERSGARAAVEQEIDRLVERSRHALDHLPLRAGPRAALAEIAAFAAGRDR